MAEVEPNADDEANWTWDTPDKPEEEEMDGLFTPEIARKVEAETKYIDPKLNFHLTPSDVVHRCPYNPDHVVLRDKFFTHILKCRNLYITKRGGEGKSVDFLVCRYNSSHHVHKYLMDHHEHGCPSRPQVVDLSARPIRGIYKPFFGDQETDEDAEETNHLNTQIALPVPSTDQAAVPAVSTAAPEEDWDAEAAGQPPREPYVMDPFEFRKQNPHIPFQRVPPGLPPAARRLWRQEQAQNYAVFNNPEAIQEHFEVVEVEVVEVVQYDAYGPGRNPNRNALNPPGYRMTLPNVETFEPFDPDLPIPLDFDPLEEELGEERFEFQEPLPPGFAMEYHRQ